MVTREKEMLTSERLLQLIMRLQRSSAAEGRRRLLDYLRKISQARRCLLLRCEQEAGELRLVERSGALPRKSRRPAPSSAVDATDEAGAFDPERIPLSGLFALPLQSGAPLYVPQVSGDARSLPVERYWTGAADCALISPLGDPEQSQGVLVLCFSPQPSAESGPESTAFAEQIGRLSTTGPFQLCLSLLTAYLTPEEEPPPPPLPPAPAGAVTPAQTAEDAQAKPAPSSNAARTQRPSRRRRRQAPPPRLPDPEELLEEERARIARVLHNGPAQELTHVLHRLEITGRLLATEPERAARELLETRQLLARSLEGLRETIATLAPASAEEIGLEMALRALLSEFSRAEPALEIRSQIEDLPPLPGPLESAVLQVLQEGLNNVRRHAQARHVEIVIRHSGDALIVRVGDNGRGLPSANEAGRARIPHEHLGLRLLDQRLRHLGGSLRVESRPAQGTILEARLPLPAATAPLTPRERQILRLLSEGATNRRIAQELALSVETVKSHVQQIMRKMHVSDRTQAAVTALRLHWLE
jgi:signal transduction histidine kinase/DNA-binding CsgD family transcriptional regulator